ncbi:DUF4177 domain-containing protein [Lysinibacillus sp. NPDC093210]|uniref:DUF4177 domain-containing protein n=1 Tax=Lysinibacillus sp. NPDC093210 TaxID=3364133 RepID=UPI00380C528A
MKKWEYKTMYWDEIIASVHDSDDFDQMLNEYGHDGWEVASMTHQVTSSALTENNGLSSVKTNSIVIVFKREYKKD